MALNTTTFESFCRNNGLLGVEQDHLDAVERKYGSPFIYDKHGAATGFNPQFAPGVYAAANKVLHDRASRTFFEYDPTTGAWVSVTNDSMKARLAELVFDLGKLLGNENIAAKERSELKLNQALNGLRAITDGSFENRPTGFIHCRNGFLEVATGELHPFDPSFLSRNPSPFKWNPRADCPRFKHELLESALDQADIRLIQQYFGLALLGRNLAQKMLLLTGTPGGGKSALCNVIEGLVGRSNVVQLRTHLLHERFELARFIGKTLLVGKDVPGDFLMARGADTLKALTGGDYMSTETKNSMRTEAIAGEFAVIVTSNSRLRVRLDGDSGAWRRRLLIVRYERPKPAKPISDFAQVLLKEEGEGILRWAVEGARELLANSYQFAVTSEQQARVDSLLDESDALSCFVREKIFRAPGKDLTTEEIVQAFFSFARDKGWTAGSVREVERSLPDLMLEHHQTGKRNGVQRGGKSHRGFSGVALVPVADSPNVADDEDENEPF